MNLPPEYYTEDPSQLPPARRRRARRLLTPMDAVERAAFLERLARRASPPFDFFIFSLFAGVMIGAGLVVDSPVLLVCGALLAPVMAPVAGLSLGTVTGSARFFLRSFLGLLVGGALVLGCGALAGRFVALETAMVLEQAYNFAQISWLNLLISILAGILATAAITHNEHAASRPSAALAYEIYIPLGVAGFGLTTGAPHLWPDGLVVFTFYLAMAALAGVFTLALMGFRPLTLFGYTLGGVLALASIILLIVIGSAGAALGTRVALPTLTPTATVTRTPIPPTATATITPVPSTATQTANLTPTLTPSPTTTITPSPTPVYARIDAGAESGGAKLRAAPGFEGRVLQTYLNDTLVQVLPDTIEVDNRIWAHVIVVADGAEGWILQSLLSIATPAPNW